MGQTAESIIDELIATEGGYVNHPSDKGGPTKYGITQKTALANGYHGDMRYLARDMARAIYLSEYWRRPNFDKVSEISELVGIELLDSGVLSGPARAAEWLQLSLNRLNMREKLYKDVLQDGKIGPKTIVALQDYMRHRRSQGGELVLLRALNCLQGHFMMVAAIEHHKPNEDFVFGWLSHRVKI